MTKYAKIYLEKQKVSQEVFKVKSSSDPSTIHKVIRVSDDVWHCSCLSFKYRYQCKHVDKIKENYGKK